MRVTLLIAILGLSACTGGSPGSSSQPLTCDSGQTLVYTNRFAPVAGGSGVATGEDAVAGKTNSDGSGSYGGVGGGFSEGGAPVATPSSPTPTPSPTTPAPAPGDPISAMVTSCEPAVCAPGQVAVEVPPMPMPVASSGPTAGGAPSGGGVDSADAPAPLPPPVMLAPPGTTVCVDPPPPCPDGQSPQFNGKGEWECTDCALVVTYGGIYGNYRRCVNQPTIVCPDGEVPTWVFEEEQWSCKTTCDNGQYDQHTVTGLLVCVPC